VTTLKRISLLLVLGACLAAAGCGGDEEGEPLPADAASSLQAQLDNVQGRLDNGTAGACRDVLEGERGPNIEQVQQVIDGLPDDVDSDVRSALEDSFDRLWELIRDRCDELAAQEQEQREQEQQEQPEPEPTDTAPPEEEEPVPPEEEEPVPPEEEEIPPDGDGETPPDEVPPEDGLGDGGGGAGVEGLE
jgi:hypothetical protein